MGYVNARDQLRHYLPLAHARVAQLGDRATTIVGRLTRAAPIAQWRLMMIITWVYAALALALAVNAFVAFAAIPKLEEPHGPRPR
jgi:hypothetical protein